MTLTLVCPICSHIALREWTHERQLEPDQALHPLMRCVGSDLRPQAQPLPRASVWPSTCTSRSSSSPCHSCWASGHPLCVASHSCLSMPMPNDPFGKEYNLNSIETLYTQKICSSDRPKNVRPRILSRKLNWCETVCLSFCWCILMARRSRVAAAVRLRFRSDTRPTAAQMSMNSMVGFHWPDVMPHSLVA